MLTFEERERAFEAKFSYDKELEFRTISRRNKLLGLWVASLVGMTGDQAQAYARTVMSDAFFQTDDEPLMQRLRQDLKNHGVHRTDREIRQEMMRCGTLARRHIEEAMEWAA